MRRAVACKGPLDRREQAAKAIECIWTVFGLAITQSQESRITLITFRLSVAVECEAECFADAAHLLLRQERQNRSNAACSTVCR